jgi:hypothetical protein
MRAISAFSLALCASACDEPREPLVEDPEPLVEDPEPDPTAGVDREDCDEPTSGPTEHDSSIDTDETWTADGSPHLLPYDTSVRATLTLEPCATVLIGPSRTVSLYPEGQLLALGLPGQAVTIGRQEPEVAWATLRTVGGTMHLEYTQVQGGGDPLNGSADEPAALHLAGPGEVLHVDHVSVEGSSSQGVTLEGGATFTSASEGLAVSGSEGYPLRVWTSSLGTVPEGDYTGNAVDEILVPGNAVTDIVREDMTVRALGVPYRVGDTLGSGELRVGSGQSASPAVLTLEPGVELRFKPGGLLSVEPNHGDEPASGALVAVGTAEQPIVLTSAEGDPQPGDWLGVWFGGEPAPSSRIEHARVEYAGGQSSTGSQSCLYDEPINDAAIRIFGPPAGRFVSDTEIVSSAAHGIDRGWSSQDAVDFLESNRFTDVALCLQSYPRDPGAACPEDPPCPR